MKRLDELIKSKDTRIKRAIELAGITMNGRKTVFSQKASKAIVIVALSDTLIDVLIDVLIEDTLDGSDPSSGTVAS